MVSLYMNYVWLMYDLCMIMLDYVRLLDPRVAEPPGN